jgi:hypothetical protein
MGLIQNLGSFPWFSAEGEESPVSLVEHVNSWDYRYALPYQAKSLFLTVSILIPRVWLPNMFFSTKNPVATCDHESKNIKTKINMLAGGLVRKHEAMSSNPSTIRGKK